MYFTKEFFYSNPNFNNKKNNLYTLSTKRIFNKTKKNCNNLFNNKRFNKKSLSSKKEILYQNLKKLIIL